MKEIVKDRLETVLDLAKEEKYHGCFIAAQTLTRFSWTAKLKDELLISEILETLFKEMDILVNTYEMQAEVKQELKGEITDGLAKLVAAYPEKNPSVVYNCLRDLRYSATSYQLHVWENYKESRNLMRHAL